MALHEKQSGWPPKNKGLKDYDNQQFPPRPKNKGRSHRVQKFSPTSFQLDSVLFLARRLFSHWFDLRRIDHSRCLAESGINLVRLAFDKFKSLGA